MEYTPSEIRQQNIEEMDRARLNEINRAPGIFRQLRATEARKDVEHLLLTVSEVDQPLKIPSRLTMTFGTETITAENYARRVIERDDQIEAVLGPSSGGFFPMYYYWIRIVYVGRPLNPASYSKKDDGLFAMRAKSGEKAERIVARHLRDNGGHIYPINSRESPGYFEIRYIGKQKREPGNPDRRCTVCGLSIEIKKRNKDQRFRVSHSEGRPFCTEHAMDGWHAFVFPDMKPRFVANEAIARLIAAGQHRPGRDAYDSWADLDPAMVTIASPPACSVIF